MGEKHIDEISVRDESSLLFEETGYVSYQSLSATERQRVMEAVPDLNPEVVPWDELGEIRSIFADLQKRAQARRVGNQHYLKRRRPAAASSLEKIIKAAEDLCDKLDSAPQELKNLLGWIDLRSRKSFSLRAGFGKRISLDETDLPNIARDAAELLASRCKDLAPQLNKMLFKDRKLAGLKMAVEMLAEVWTKTLKRPIYLIMRDDAEDGVQPFARFVEAVFHDIDSNLSVDRAIRAVHEKKKALDSLR